MNPDEQTNETVAQLVARLSFMLDADTDFDNHSFSIKRGNLRRLLDALRATDPAKPSPKEAMRRGEQCVIVCPQCEGEGSYADGLDEAACTTECTRCVSNGWIVDLCALRATEPAQGGDADRAFELWFFRDIVDDQRSKLIALMLGDAVAKEATNHGTQRLCLKYILKALRAQGRAEAEREIVALRETVLDEDWLEEAISDSLDLDWQPRIAARLILSRLKESAIDAQG